MALTVPSVSSVSNREAERPFGGKSPAHERHLQDCNSILANWTKDELSGYLDSVIDDALGVDSTEANIAKLTLLTALKHGVSIRRLCASCSDFSLQSQPDAYSDFCTGYGADTSFSGLLMVPLLEDGSIVNGTHPGGIWLHGTSTQSVPSVEFRGADSGIDLMVNAAFASTGTITMMPDYMGYGESSGQVFKAYLVKRQYQTSIIPLWLMAGRMIQEETDCMSALADSAAILGYSEGGYAAVALAEGLYNMGVDILKVEAGAGPYRMGSAALLDGQRLVDEGIFPLEVREYFALVGAAYSSTYPELANFEQGQDLLASDVRDEIVELITNSASKDEIQALIPADDPTSVFSPQLVAFTQNALADGDSDPCNNAGRVIEGVNDKICEALQDNDLTELLETTPYPVRLCHSPDDDVVSYANLPDFDTNVLLERLDSTGNHVEAATTCLLQSVLFMLSDDFLSASVIEKTTDMGCAATGASSAAFAIESLAPSEASSSPTTFDTAVPSLSPAPTTSPMPTSSPRPTSSPTKRIQCGETLASWNKDDTRGLVSEMYADTYGLDSPEYALFELFADQSFQYGVEIRKICSSCSEISTSSSGYSEYCDQGVYGSGATQSGLLMLPLSSDGTAIANGTFPGFVYNHEPTVDRVPSNDWMGGGGTMANGIMFGVIPAAAGNVAILPDYLGYGEGNKDISKAFLVKKSYQTSIVPLWLKAVAILEQETTCSALADAAMISGFSEGGYSSIVVADALSNLGVDIIRVEAGAVPARLGSIFIPDLVESIESGNFPSNLRFMLALLGSSYSATYNGMPNFEEGPYFLESSVRNNIVDLVTDAASLMSVQGAVPETDPLSIFNQEVVDWARRAYLLNDTNPCGAGDFTTEGFELFCSALAENDLTDLFESASYPVALCHGRDDGVVSTANLPDATTNANILISIVDGDHAASYVACTSRFITFLSSPTFTNYPIVPKHDTALCQVTVKENSPVSAPVSTPAPVSSISSWTSASLKTATVSIASVVCGLSTMVFLV